MKLEIAIRKAIDNLSRVLDDDLPDAMDQECCDLADEFGIDDVDIVWNKMHDIMMGVE